MAQIPPYPSQDSQDQEPETPKFRGLYRYVKISVRTLDIIIAACVIVIIVAAIAGMNGGPTVTFDSRGGTDVAAVDCEPGEKLVAPEPPTREGYTFTGWYRDPNCTDMWDMSEDLVSEDITLYAGWSKNDP